MSNLFQEIQFEKSTVKLVQTEHAIVSDFTFRFFEFSIVVAVVDRSRVGPETNVFVGIARARIRTTITTIDGRPCVLGLALSAIHLFISPL